MVNKNYFTIKGGITTFILGTVYTFLSVNCIDFGIITRWEFNWSLCFRFLVFVLLFVIDGGYKFDTR